jgi:hypothetical protein
MMMAWRGVQRAAVGRLKEQEVKSGYDVMNSVEDARGEVREAG